MRRNLLIAGLILLLLGFAINGVVGSFLLAVGILLLLYVFFSRESTTEAETARYVEPDHDKETVHEIERERSREYVKPKPRHRNVDIAKKELRAWDSNKRAKKCPECGSTNNPPYAKFCADCGHKF